jgi:lipopolysaccharide/colanic/teichoic acid biosynthesis glycosyltransferase
LSTRRARMAPISDVPLLYVEPRDVSSLQRFTKRAMDLVLGTALLVLTAPLVAAAALVIKLTDRGPIIHRSTRVGRFGVTISVLKLRTMVLDASKINVDALNERTGGPLFKATHDPRVTKVGGVLRATSIDELPQLWNVLNGTMSIVGPRPALLHEVQHFDSELQRRHQMRPGITGLWQVDARDNPSFSAYRRLDLSYIDDWSLTLDAAIMACTVHQLFARAGAAVTRLVVSRKPLPDATPQAHSAGGVVNDTAPPV